MVREAPLARPNGTIHKVHAANACFGGPGFRALFVASADKFLGIPTKVVGIKPLPRNPPANSNGRRWLGGNPLSPA
jgi:hypothetical protein